MTLRPTLSSSTKVTLTASFSVVVIFAVHQSSCMCQKKLKNLFTSLYQCNPWWKSVLMTDRPLLWEDQPLWNCSFYTCLQLTPFRPTADSIIHAYSWFHHTCLQVTPSYMPTADSIIHAYSWLHHTCLQLTPSYMPASDSIIHAYSWLHHTCLQLTPSYMPTADSIIHAYSWFHHTCLQVTPSYMPTADSIIHAYSWLHHTCLQLTPSYMPASESLTDPHMGSTVLCTEVYVFCTAGYCIYLFRGFVAPSTWYDCRDLSLSGTRRGLLENKTVLVCMSHRNWLPRSLLGECLRL